MRNLFNAAVVALAACFLISTPALSRTTYSSTSDWKPATKCVRVLQRSKVLGCGCFVATYGYYGAIEVLRGLGYSYLADALEQIGEKASDAIRKAFEEHPAQPIPPAN